MVTQIESNVTRAKRMQLRSVAWTHGHMVTQIESNVTRATSMQLRSVAWTHGRTD
jgi:hypothetical protein